MHNCNGKGSNGQNSLSAQEITFTPCPIKKGSNAPSFSNTEVYEEQTTRQWLG